MCELESIIEWYLTLRSPLWSRILASTPVSWLMYPSNLSSHSLILSSHPHHILRVSVHLHLSISLLAISQAITHIGRCKSIAYRDCFHTKGTTHRIVHSQSCTWSVHMHITRSPLNLDRSVSIACIYNKSMRSLTQRYIYTRLRMNRLKCWSSYVWSSSEYWCLEVIIDIDV